MYRCVDECVFLKIVSAARACCCATHSCKSILNYYCFCYLYLFFFSSFVLFQSIPPSEMVRKTRQKLKQQRLAKATQNDDDDDVKNDKPSSTLTETDDTAVSTTTATSPTNQSDDSINVVIDNSEEKDGPATTTTTTTTTTSNNVDKIIDEKVDDVKTKEPSVVVDNNESRSSTNSNKPIERGTRCFVFCLSFSFFLFWFLYISYDVRVFVKTLPLRWRR
jgi:hypothetical protein